jgi:acyl-CoA synthetase (AMP-forming)/AMP-acid ligase II
VAREYRLDFFGKTYTYARLAEMVNRIAKGLQEMGVKKGTRVGLFMPNCPQYVMCYYAVLKIGGTVVNFNPLYSGHEIEHQLKRRPCRGDGDGESAHHLRQADTVHRQQLDAQNCGV